MGSEDGLPIGVPSYGPQAKMSVSFGRCLKMGDQLKRLDVAVVGAGINGLAAAWNLQRMGAGEVAVFEAAQIGHGRGSSHGAVRIARSAYSDSGYVRLMQRSFAETWPRLEHALGRSLLSPLPGCFFGPAGGLIDDYAAAVRGVCPEVEPIVEAVATRLFPGLDLTGCRALNDRTAAIIDAAGAVDGLTALVRDRSPIYEETPVLSIESGADGVRLSTHEGDWLADRVVLTAGPWLGRLCAAVGERLTVYRQTVGFFEAENGGGRPGGDCVWVYVGETDEEHFYGLPESPTVLKAAPHVRSGIGHDPDGSTAHSAQWMDRLQKFVGRHIAGPTRLVDVDTCPYTVTDGDDAFVYE